ncbi:GtrA family protein [Rhodococcus sp. IEGM 1408]|uniref:GtrA family protein n=1 Tax=Rhodococcus sp. IEGM 1408 TaxID=3082220 RepID=UPI002954401E|nr:GtrA family protein [Rhodococcus sp. IEGM 1408]MDV8002109.1 GtrA family protein [Rhodococcus sp. IEGM 1408]
MSSSTSDADLPDDSVLDSLRGAVDPLEPRHESDPSQPTDLKTQVIRFFLTGVLSAVVDYGLLQLMMAFGVDYGLAKALSFVAGTLTAYSLNRRWTFQAEPSRARFLVTMALYAVMFGVQWGLFMLLTPWFLGMDWSPFWATTAAYVVAQGVATVTNFVVQRTVIFRVR